MACRDKSQRIEFIIPEHELSFEEKYGELLKPIAQAVGQHAIQGHESGVRWFKQVFEIIINTANEILDEKKK